MNRPRGDNSIETEIGGSLRESAGVSSPRQLRAAHRLQAEQLLLSELRIQREKLRRLIDMLTEDASRDREAPRSPEATMSPSCRRGSARPRANSPGS